MLYSHVERPTGCLQCVFGYCSADTSQSLVVLSGKPPFLTLSYHRHSLSQGEEWKERRLENERKPCLDTLATVLFIIIVVAVT